MFIDEFNDDRIVPFVERNAEKMKNLDILDVRLLSPQDRFIYLTGGGLKQLINVVVQLHSDPQKRALVNLDFNDTIEFIIKKIGESMERFDIYKGLLGLRAINLAKKTGRSKVEPISLPDTPSTITTEGSVISSTTQVNNSGGPPNSHVTAKQLFNDQDMLYCDIHSYEVWVELKIALQSPVKRYKVFLFMKVDRNLTI